MLPTTLVIAIAAQHEGIPFPAVFEAFLMEVSFEILQKLVRCLMCRACNKRSRSLIWERLQSAGLVSPIMIIILLLQLLRLL